MQNRAQVTEHLCAMNFLSIAVSHITIIFYLLGSATPAQAARLALVIGNDSYTQVAVLKNARNDARLMAQTLRDAKFDVRLLENADGKNLWRAVEALGKRIQSGDEVVFFFSGHGVQIEGDAVLLPVDIKAESDKQVLREGLRLLDVQDEFKNAKVSLLVIDACRDNPFPKQGTRTIGGGRGLLVPEVKGQAIIMSAGRGQKALDFVPGKSNNNGLFTYEFVRAIKSGLDVRNALVQVRDNVDDAAKRVNAEQRPSLIDDLRGQFYFFTSPTSSVSGVGGVTTNSNARLQTADEVEQQAWNTAVQSNSSAGFGEYLAEYPRGKFVASAKVQLADSRLLSNQSAATSELDGFILLPDGVARDKVTGLEWMRCSLGQTWDGITCQGRAGRYTFEGAQQATPFGWRVPTIHELNSLVYCSNELNRIREAKFDDGGVPLMNTCQGESGKDYLQTTIRTNVFPNSAGNLYWSSSSHVVNRSYAWVVYFVTGGVNDDAQSNFNYVRLVRASQSPNN